MDISAEYINMCSKAQEIQKKWAHSNRSSGDWYFHNELGAAYVVSEIDQDDKDCIFLPRQDQLQEMIDGDLSVKMEDIYLYNYSTGFVWLSDGHLSSFEQLWLAFVMNEKYNKIWDKDKKEWISN